MHCVVQGLQLTNDKQTNLHSSLGLMLETLLICSPNQSLHIASIFLDAVGEQDRRSVMVIGLWQRSAHVYEQEKQNQHHQCCRAQIAELRER
jgi:hypothetical protein